MDFLRLSQYSSFIETISPDRFDISIIVGEKKRCALGWATEFDDRVTIWQGISIAWEPTKEWGYATVAARLFDMTELHARQLFHADVRDTNLLPWVKVRCDNKMTPKDMGQRIRDFVEYFEAHPEELTPPIPEMDITDHDPNVEVVEDEVVTEEEPQEEPEPIEPVRRLTPREILGL